MLTPIDEVLVPVMTKLALDPSGVVEDPHGIIVRIVYQLLDQVVSSDGINLESLLQFPCCEMGAPIFLANCCRGRKPAFQEFDERLIAHPSAECGRQPVRVENRPFNEQSTIKAKCTTVLAQFPFCSVEVPNFSNALF